MKMPFIIQFIEKFQEIVNDYSKNTFLELSKTRKAMVQVVIVRHFLRIVSSAHYSTTSDAFVQWRSKLVGISEQLVQNCSFTIRDQIEGEPGGCVTLRLGFSKFCILKLRKKHIYSGFRYFSHYTMHKYELSCNKILKFHKTGFFAKTR